MKDYHRFEIEQCELNPDIDAFKSFAAIPKDKVSESSLVAWLVAGGKLAQIPQDLRTEAVLFAAVRHDMDAYEQIPVDAVTDHRQLSLEALKQGNTNFDEVPEIHKDEAFLIEMVVGGTRTLSGVRLQTDYEHLLTENLARTVFSRTVAEAYDLVRAGGPKAQALLKDEYLESAIRAQTSDYGFLAALGKEYVLTAMIKSGFWPEQRNFRAPASVSHFKIPPANPDEAAERISSTIIQGFKVLHRCWLKAQPLPEVVDALQASEAGLNELFNTFREQDLRPFIKTYRSIRGRILPNDLGL
jgi:hypothetical protein